MKMTTKQVMIEGLENPAYDIWSKTFPYGNEDILARHKRLYGDNLPSLDMATLRKGAEEIVNKHLVRDQVVHTYAWAVPSPEILHEIKFRANGRGIIEIGAGSGYWAKLLNSIGVDIVAYDLQPYKNHWMHNDKKFYEVKRGDHTAIQEHKDRLLFLCWPPYDGGVLLDACLDVYTQDLIFYIGEWSACTSWSDRFEKEWEDIHTIPCPQWDGIHDCLFVMSRKSNIAEA
jgi:hypothetical protein